MCSDTISKTDALAESARMRAGVYAFLADIFRSPLSAGSLRKIRSSAFFGTLLDIGVELEVGFCSASENVLLDRLAIDFTQLFHGPRDHIVPYESVQIGTDGGTLNGQAARRVRDFMDASGISLNEDCRELPDHISVEFEVMAELLRREAEAIEEPQRHAAAYWETRQREFFDRHLGRWGPKFGDVVAERADTVFYRELGGLMTNFLEVERSLLCRRPEDEAQPKEARIDAS